MKRALVFPGQGAQFPGMGKELADASATARHLFEEVDDALSQHLSRLMFEGPESDLMLTENAQPALLTASLAVMRVLEAEAGFDLAQKAAYVAGHSLGEYSALAAAGALAVPEAARLVKQRGQAMQKAVPVGEGAMAALLGLDIDAAREVAEEASAGELVCAVANDNSPGQIVVSGHAAAVAHAIALAAGRGSRRGIMLPVSAPFHSPLMLPAAEVMKDALADAALQAPAVPLVANVTARETTDPGEIKELLVEQVTHMVRWRETVELFAANEVEEIVEVGAGRVLSGLVKRINRDLAAVSVGTPAEIDALLKRL
ncbi:MAG: ACP S-malonyltransferase [Alphaproteobacteria bacterium]|nr:ACP S-malonyltransferase [Alphaproteobacteria bacterium]MBV9151844.1 ACP S-malonyltransferase [Alphaproteobacteria bacterium]